MKTFNLILAVIGIAIFIDVFFIPTALSIMATMIVGSFLGSAIAYTTFKKLI